MPRSVAPFLIAEVSWKVALGRLLVITPLGVRYGWVVESVCSFFEGPGIAAPTHLRNGLPSSPLCFPACFPQVRFLGLKLNPTC